jgi:hypothetical protein
MKYIETMKHLASFEKFAYHSPKKEGMKESSDTHQKIEKHRCFKCKKKSKPQYNLASGEIPRLF